MAPGTENDVETKVCFIQQALLKAMQDSTDNGDQREAHQPDQERDSRIHSLIAARRELTSGSLSQEEKKKKRMQFQLIFY